MFYDLIFVNNIQESNERNERKVYDITKNI